MCAMKNAEVRADYPQLDGGLCDAHIWIKRGTKGRRRDGRAARGLHEGEDALECEWGP